MQSGAGNRLSAFQNPDTVAQTYDSVGMQSPASLAQLDVLLCTSHTTAKTSTKKFKYMPSTVRHHRLAMYGKQ
jgi:hypothetical protein